MKFREKVTRCTPAKLQGAPARPDAPRCQAKRPGTVKREGEGPGDEADGEPRVGERLSGDTRLAVTEAAEVGALLIVSNDTDLLSMSPWRGTPIIEPAAFAAKVDAMRRHARRRRR